MSTYAELVVIVSRALRDPANGTFSTDEVGDMIDAGLAEVGRISPMQFQQDITPVANQLEYPLNTTADPEIDLTRVEVWHIAEDLTPKRYMTKFRAGSKEYMNSSDVGWRVWNGVLYLTNHQEYFLDPDVHFLRVWGYGPYPPVSGGGTIPVSRALEQAIISYCRVEAFRRLTVDRDLFTQWQTMPNNVDASPGGLLSALTVAEDDWRRKKRELYLIREGQ